MSQDKSPRDFGKVESTSRFEAFTDGVFAIVLTILIFEVKPPALSHDISVMETWHGIKSILPQFTSFAFSFVVIAIYWVNHHHYFHLLARTDWKVLWYNIHFLFWLCIIPFTTAFSGDNISNSVVVSVYALVMMMCAFSFTLMGHYIFIKNPGLMKSDLPMKYKNKQLVRGYMGVVTYFVAMIMAYVYVYISLGIIALVPFAYFIPQLMSGGEEE